MYIRIVAIIVFCLVLWNISTYIKLDYKKYAERAKGKFIQRINNFVAKQEKRQNEAIKKGEIKGFLKNMLMFVNDLLIDLGLKRIGMPVTEFLLFVFVSCFLLAESVSIILFGSVFLGILLFPMLVVLFFCIIYTKTSTRRYERIEEILTAENIIASNIMKGMLGAVKDNSGAIPFNIRQQFEVFVDDIEQRNYEIEQAINLLTIGLGQTSEEFMQKVIIIEKYDEKGFIDIFQDVVEINGIKKLNRQKMSRTHKEITTDFVIATSFTVAVLIFSIMTQKVLRHFYLENIIGQILIVIDILIIITVFMLLTALKAREI